MRRPSGGCGALVAAVLLGWALSAGAQDEPKTASVSIALKDGSMLVGRIVNQDETSLTFVTTGGLEVRIERALVVSIKEVEPAGRRSDPNYARLMFAPTGRPLKKGDGYFSDHYVLFPGFAYGLTDALSLGGGVSVIPGLGLGEQLFYVSSQWGVQVGGRAALAGGALYAAGGEDSGAAILYGVGTFGRPDRSLTVGIGFGGTRNNDERFRWRDGPILMVGGTLRLSDRVTLVFENWIFIGSDLDEQPFGLALRFFGDRISADVGLVLVGEVLEEGLPVPWLSFSYHFGPSKARAARRDRR